jgi:AcrR family transcriptional regulator
MPFRSTTVGTRRVLLGAARQELAEHESAAVSLRAVARRAGLSHVALNHHFADRARLLTAMRHLNTNGQVEW